MDLKGIGQEDSVAEGEDKWHSPWESNRSVYI